MNKEQIKGEANEIKGDIKEGAGKAVGDKPTEGEGKLDQVKGSIQQGFGNVKEKVEQGLDKAAEKLNIDRDKERDVA